MNMIVCCWEAKQKMPSKNGDRMLQLNHFSCTHLLYSLCFNDWLVIYLCVVYAKQKRILNELAELRVVTECRFSEPKAIKTEANSDKPEILELKSIDSIAFASNLLQHAANNCSSFYSIYLIVKSNVFLIEKPMAFGVYLISIVFVLCIHATKKKRQRRVRHRMTNSNFHTTHTQINSAIRKIEWY